MLDSTVSPVIHTEKSLAYASEVRAAHDLALQPVGLDDPRRQELARATGRSLDYLLKFDEEHLADLWWQKAAPKPPLPMDAPSWAVDTEVTWWEYPEIGVTYRGRKHTSVDEIGVKYEANLVLGLTVFVDGNDDGAAGDIMEHDRIAIEFGRPDDVLSVSGATHLSIALTAAAEELREVEEAGR